MEERHVYMCNHSATDKISWRVNGRVLGIDISPLNVTSDIISLPGGGRVSTLTIGGLPEHNETTIRCAAIFDNRSIPVVSPNVNLLIQGLYAFAKYIYMYLTSSCLHALQDHCKVWASLLGTLALSHGNLHFLLIWQMLSQISSIMWRCTTSLVGGVTWSANVMWLRPVILMMLFIQDASMSTLSHPEVMCRVLPVVRAKQWQVYVVIYSICHVAGCLHDEWNGQLCWSTIFF